jgi:hypothetical protein
LRVSRDEFRRRNKLRRWPRATGKDKASAGPSRSLDRIAELKRCRDTRHFFVELVIGIKYLRLRVLVQTLNVNASGVPVAAVDECRRCSVLFEASK